MKKLMLFCGAGLLALGAFAMDWTALDWGQTPGVTREGTVLTVTRTEVGSTMPSVPVDLSPFAGKCLRGRIRVKATDLQPGPQSWLGYKFMLSFRDAETGKREWPGAPSLKGTFDWSESVFECDFRGKKPTEGRLTLGLQDTRGRVSFDLASLVLEEVKPLFEIDTSSNACVYSAAVKSRPVKRGVMLPSGPCKEDDFKTLHAWGAKLARYQMMRGWGEVRGNRDIAEYTRWVDSKVDHLLNDVLPWAEKYDIDLVVDLHVAPGGVEESQDMVMFHEAAYADAFVAVWRRIATRCKGQKRIWGYDLINEPVQHVRGPEGIDYLSLQMRAAREVRKIDAVTPIILESNDSAAPTTYRFMQTLDLPDVIYQIHMYYPGEFTHQGVHAKSAKDYRPCRYPDPAKGWDRKGLRKILAPARDFQLRHGARIYVGEFSAIAWAEGADAYLRDCISLFEEYGWDWTYHAFREWDGWSVEKEATGWRQLRPCGDSPRKRVLLEGLSLPKR